MAVNLYQIKEEFPWRKKLENKKRKQALKWGYSKRSYLWDRLLSLLEIYEDLLGGWGDETTQDFIEMDYEIAAVYEAENLKVLLKRLVHYQTLIHKSERSCIDGNKWCSERSDLLGALVLIEELVSLSKESIEYNRDACLLAQIKEVYEKGVCFKTGEVYRKLRHRNRRELSKGLRRLRESGLLKQVGGDRYNGYVYECP